MANFDRFDICEAHNLLEADYNVSGVLQERVSNKRRNMSSGFQLSRMGFKLSHNGGTFEHLTENGKDIYCENVLKMQLPIDAELKKFMLDTYVSEFLNESRPDVFVH